MVTLDNYDLEIQKIGLQNLSPVLKETHRWFLQAREFYNLNEEIKETIDLYFKRLDKLLPKGKGNTIDGATTLDAEIVEEFLSLHNNAIPKGSILKLIKKIHNGIAEKQITKSSPYAQEIRTIQEKLVNIYNNSKSPLIKIVIGDFRSNAKSSGKKSKPKSLDGFEHRIKSLTSQTTIKPKVRVSTPSGFVNIDDLDDSQTGEGFCLQGAIGKLLGNLERYRLAITIEGDQGGGKTRFTYQLADTFADNDFKVGIYSLEIGKKSDLVRRMRDEYIKPGNRRKVLVTGEAPEGIETIKKNAKYFDVIVIDSWNKIDANSKEFDKLRNEFPDIIWVVIFQRTAGGSIRGGTAPLYDAGINIEVVKSNEGFKNNYAHCTKNRYGETGIRYSIAERNII